MLVSGSKSRVFSTTEDDDADNESSSTDSFSEKILRWSYQKSFLLTLFSLVVVILLLILVSVGYSFLQWNFVRGSIDAMLPMISIVQAISGLQTPMIRSEHAAYLLSIATSSKNATLLFSTLQSELVELSVQLNKLNRVNPVVGGMIIDTLVLPIVQWSQLGNFAVSNASASFTYLQTMSALYSAQFAATENTASLVGGTIFRESTTALNEISNIISVSTRGIFLIAAVICALILLIPLLLLLFYSRSLHLAALALELSEQRDIAEAALCAKNRFLAIVSHEFRTPLNGVLGPLQLLSDALEQSEYQPLVRASISAAEVLLTTINNLLDYRMLLDADVLPVSAVSTSIDLSTLLNDIDSLIRPAMLDKHLHYQQLCYSTTANGAAVLITSATQSFGAKFNQPALRSLAWPSRVRVDTAALSQVLMNMLSNAHKYTAAFGEVTMAWTLVSISGGTSLQHLGSNAAAADLNISAAIELASTNINTLSSYVNSISVAIPVAVVPSSARTTSIPGSARVASKMTPVSSRRAIASATSKFISFAHFRVEIIDTGVGIPPDLLKTVFEAFSGVNQTSTRAFDGLGLGLAIASELAMKKLGTHISVTSELGHGSTFAFDLVLPIDPDVVDPSLSPSFLKDHSLSQINSRPTPDAAYSYLSNPSHMQRMINHAVPQSQPLSAAAVRAKFQLPAIPFASLFSASPDLSRGHTTGPSVPDDATSASDAGLSSINVMPKLAVLRLKPASFLPPSLLPPQPFRAVTTTMLPRGIVASPAFGYTTASRSLLPSQTIAGAISAASLGPPDTIHRSSQSQGFVPHIILSPPSERNPITSMLTLAPIAEINSSVPDVVSSETHEPLIIPTFRPVLLFPNDVVPLTPSQQLQCDPDSDTEVTVLTNVETLLQRPSEFVLPSTDNSTSDLQLSSAGLPKGLDTQLRTLTTSQVSSLRQTTLLRATMGAQPLTLRGLISPAPIQAAPMASSLRALIAGARSVHNVAFADNTHSSPPRGMPISILAEESPLSLPQLHILLVEDNLLNQKFALTLLGKMGHSVVLAENGQEAVAKWRATLSNAAISVPILSSITPSVAVHLGKLPSFDICLMDLAMPVRRKLFTVMDGFTATATIRQIEETMVLAGESIIPLPIVAVSANSIDSKPKCLAVGMQGYITKPIRKPDLVQHLRKFGCGRHVHGSPTFLLANTPSAITLMSPLTCSTPAGGMVSGSLVTSPDCNPQLVAVSHSYADTPTQFPSTSRQALSLRPLGMRTPQVAGRRVPLPKAPTPTNNAASPTSIL